jgi:hypothetical protein
MIAKKRGLDPELASMAAMLHDLYAYESGSYDDHAHKGAELAQQILEELALTDKHETELICSAVYHHDDKLVVNSPMDEADLKGKNIVQSASQPQFLFPEIILHLCLHSGGLSTWHSCNYSVASFFVDKFEIFSWQTSLPLLYCT